MAALNRPTKATYELHEEITVDTQDNEDHTFCGIMFPVKCKDILPLDHLVIKSVAVRGRLGPLTVWVSNPDQHTRGDQNIEHRVRLHPKYWTKLFDKRIGASRHTYKELLLESPIVLRPGETRVIYIHSTLPGDEAIVYDNSYYGQSSKRYEDDKLAILTGRAHVSSEVFGQEPIWGWGNAWRDRREFVGRLEYGTVYKLWSPQIQPKFGGHFQDGARALLLCQRRWESPMSMLPDECLFYILNMCRWDWFEDNSDTMKQRRLREKARRLRKLEETAKRAEEAENTLVGKTRAAAEVVDQKMSPCSGKKGVKKADEDGDVRMDFAWAETNADEEDDDEDFDEADGEEEKSSDGDSEAEWSDDEDQYHRANVQAFSYRDIESDGEEEEDGEDDAVATSRREWIRRQFARIHVLRALASMEDGAVAHVHF